MRRPTTAELFAENVRLASWYANRLSRVPVGLTRDDLEAAALLGVWEAAAEFDPARGLKFSTLAVPLIRSQVSRLTRKACRRGLVGVPKRDRPRVVTGATTLAGTDLVGELPDRDREVGLVWDDHEWTAALAPLSVVSKSVVLLRIVHGQSFEAIEERLELRSGGAGRLYAKAVETLRECHADLDGIAG